MEKPTPHGIQSERELAAEGEWRNPANWRWGLFYAAPSESQVSLRQDDPALGSMFNCVHRVNWRWQTYLLAGLLGLIAAQHWLG